MRKLHKSTLIHHHGNSSRAFIQVERVYFVEHIWVWWKPEIFEFLLRYSFEERRTRQAAKYQHRHRQLFERCRLNRVQKRSGNPYRL